jgi:exportin-1
MDSNQYYVLKQMIFKIFKSFVRQMNVITKQANMADEYNRISLEQKMNFEEFCLQFLLCLISFFKSNMNFLEEFDFVQGTSQPSDFLMTYLAEIELGMTYICQINQIPNEEIFRACAEFWNWFCFKVCFLKEKNIDPETISFTLLKDTSMNDYIAYTSQLFLYQYLYFKVLEKVRQILICRMTKPVEVKISVDSETGEIVVEGITNTTFQTLYETLKECLIYLTHLDPVATNNFMLESLQMQTAEQNWNPCLLNSICWSIGSIAGAMEESHEKKFLVMVIKVSNQF